MWYQLFGSSQKALQGQSFKLYRQPCFASKQQVETESESRRICFKVELVFDIRTIEFCFQAIIEPQISRQLPVLSFVCQVPLFVTIQWPVSVGHRVPQITQQDITLEDDFDLDQLAANLDRYSGADVAKPRKDQPMVCGFLPLKSIYVLHLPGYSMSCLSLHVYEGSGNSTLVAIISIYIILHQKCDDV